MGASGGEPGEGQATPRPFLERGPELAQLRRAVEGAARNQPSVVLIQGEAGIGKTRLAEEAARAASGLDLIVAWGRPWDPRETPSYWAWQQVFSQLGLRRFVGDQVADLSIGRLDFFDGAMKRLIRRASRKPVLVLLDDLHDIDEGSIVFLRYVARNLDRAQICVVVTYREDDLDPASIIAEAISDIRRLGTTIDLQPLTSRAVADLVAEITGLRAPKPIEAAVVEASGGNPLFVEEIARHLAHGGDIRRPDRSSGFQVPRSLEFVLRRRLDSVVELTERRLIEAASVLGPTFEVPLVAQLVESDPIATEELLEILEDRGLVERRSVQIFSFRHPLLRELLYESQPVGTRKILHRRAAEALQQRDRASGAIADHLYKAVGLVEPGVAIAACLEAGEREAGEFAFEAAARHYYRALRLAKSLGADATILDGISGSLEAAEAAIDAGEGEPEEPAVPPSLKREGDYWTFSFQGRTSRYKHALGFAFLSTLLRSPGQEFHVLDLAAGVPERRGPVERMPVAGDDSGPVLDPRALREYRQRIGELEEQLQEAQDLNDQGRESSLKTELDFLSSELAKATGLGGRSRRAFEHSERARVSVTRALRLAISKIERHDQVLGRHLQATISTGTFVAYAPDPLAAVRWEF